jgi:hypothetical protein
MSADHVAGATPHGPIWSASPAAALWFAAKPIETLIRAHDAGLAAALKFVYAGNRSLLLNHELASLMGYSVVIMSMMMRSNYDFSKARKNPYAKRLKNQVTIRLAADTIRYFKCLAAQTRASQLAILESP